MAGFGFKLKALTFAVYNLLFSKFKVIRYPVNAGWFTSNVGSGAVTQGVGMVRIVTGTTASSRGLIYTFAQMLNSGTIGADYIDLSKPLQVSVVFVKDGYNDPEVVARFQIKTVSTEGTLAALGFGIEINNFDMLGEAYGTSRGTVALFTMTADRVTRLRIVLVPNTRVEFWVNDVLRGTLTGAYVPTGSFVSYMVWSIINGLTPAGNAILGVQSPEILQQW